MFEDLEESKSASIKEIFEKVKYYLKELSKRWYLLIAFGLVFSAYLWYYASSSDVHYEAELSFVVKNNQSGAAGMDDVLAELGWGRAEGSTNMAKIKKIAFSKSVIMEAMYDSVVINNKRDLLANHMLDIYNFAEAFKKSGSKFQRFDVAMKYSDSNKVQNSAFNSILGLVRGGDGANKLFAVTADNATDIMTFDIRSINEELSYHLGTRIYESLSEFYMQDERKGATKAVAVLKQETDSVGRLLKSKEYQLANAVDRNYGIILSKNQVNQDVIRRDIEMLTGLYTQMRQRLESNQFGLRYGTSMFDVLEHPVLPLKKKKKSPLIYGLIGLAIGIGLITLFLVIRRFLLDELK